MALRSYKSMDDVHMDKTGPCIIPGHQKEHKLTLACITAIRRWCLDDPKRTFNDLIREVDRK